MHMRGVLCCRSTLNAPTTTHVRWIYQTVASASDVVSENVSRLACDVNTFFLMTSAPSNVRKSSKTGRADCMTIHFDLNTSDGASFFEWGSQRGAKSFLGGQVYVVANNALPQYGTHTPLFQVPLPFLWSLFSLCCLWFLSFSSLIPISRPFLLWYS